MTVATVALVCALCGWRGDSTELAQVPLDASTRVPEACPECLGQCWLDTSGNAVAGPPVLMPGRVETDPRAYASRVPLDDVQQASVVFATAVTSRQSDADTKAAFDHFDAVLRARLANAFADGWAAAERHRLQPNETPAESQVRAQLDREIAARNESSGREQTRFAMQNPGLGIQGLRTH